MASVVRLIHPAGAQDARRFGVCCAVIMAAVSGLLSAWPLHAASLGVSPTLVELVAPQGATGVRISNQHPDAAVNVQARLFRWQQEDGQNVYTPADDLVISPPLTRIAPGREHLIRLVRSGSTPDTGEHSYRLLLDELPAPVETDDSGHSEVSGALSLVIRQSIPVFVSSPAATPAAPQWRVERAPGGDGQAGYLLGVHNTGDKRLRLSDLVLSTAEGEVLAQHKGLVGYALGHAQMQFLIPDVDGVESAAAAAATSLMLTVQTESGALRIGALPVHAAGN